MPASPTFLKFMSRSHIFWYRLTGGLLGGSILGRPILLLTTTGRKSGRSRTIPLQYVEDGENLVVIASNAGNPFHPDWWLNLEKNPQAEVQIKGERRRVRAEAAAGDERERLWKAAVRQYAGYEDYQKTAEREIPVVVLRPEAA